MTNPIPRFDSFQRRHPLLAFPLAVLTKFSEDQGTNQAALIAYYGFLSLFPLLLLLLTVLEKLLPTDSALRDKIVAGALSVFPALGGELERNIHELHGSTEALIVSGLLTLLGGLGIAGALQSAFNHVWRVPATDRPGRWLHYVRDLGLVLTIGLGTIVAGVVTGYAANSHLATWEHILGLLLGLAINTTTFLLAFDIGTASSIKRSDLRVGAIVAATVWMGLQAVGSLLIVHQIKHMNALYGTFALVLGMLWWLYLQAQVTVYAMEINVVRTRKLWPRKLT